MMDLKKIYGGRFRITTDPAASARNTDPWMWMIPCRRWRGEVYPHDLDGEVLAFLGRSKRVNVAIGLLEGIGCEVHVAGEDEFIVTFPLGIAEAVFDVVQPRRKRKLSEEHRRKLAEANRGFRFKPLKPVLGGSKPVNFESSPKGK